MVRKWVRRFQAEGEEGLKDRSRRPHDSPRQTSPEIEKRVREARKATRYGRERLSLCLERGGLEISPDTIRHILRRRCDPTKRRRKRRKPCVINTTRKEVPCNTITRGKPLYPALWAWEVEEPFGLSLRTKPFSLIQTDVKDILDKQALGRSAELTTKPCPLGPSAQTPSPPLPMDSLRRPHSPPLPGLQSPSEPHQWLGLPRSSPFMAPGP